MFPKYRKSPNIVNIILKRIKFYFRIVAVGYVQEIRVHTLQLMSVSAEVFFESKIKSNKRAINWQKFHYLLIWTLAYSFTLASVRKRKKATVNTCSRTRRLGVVLTYNVLQSVRKDFSFNKVN